MGKIPKVLLLDFLVPEAYNGANREPQYFGGLKKPK